MKQREDEIESQRGINLTDRQVFARPCAEKNECSDARQNLNDREFSFDESYCQQTEVDDEQITEQKRRPIRDCPEIQQVKRREHRHRRETDRAREKCGVRLSGALCPRSRGQEQRLKTNKHCHENENSVACEIFLRNKEGT